MDLTPYLQLAGFDYRSAPARRESAEIRATYHLPAPLLQSLRSVLEELPSDRKREENLSLLGKPGTLCVVTGQQPGLFGGPLFTLAKTLTAIRFAEVLSAELDRPVVPIFWLQSEDHDYLEVSTATALPLSGPVSSVTLKPFGAERASLGALLLPQEIAETLAEFSRVIAGLPFATELISLLQRAYTVGTAFPIAFARVLSALLPESGLLFFDPRRDPTLAQTLFREAIIKRHEIERVLEARENSLRSQNLSPQVKLRKNSPLFFLHDKNGERFRLEESNGVFTQASAEDRLSGESWNEGELLELLERSPERFSTSALLRPALQDTLFPTAAYIGGEAEVRYFAQASAVHEVLKLPRPMVVPRSSIRLIDDRSARLLAELGITTEQVGEENTRKALALKSIPHELLPDSIRDTIRMQLKPVKELLHRAVEGADQTLAQPAEKTTQKIQESIDNFLGRYEKAVIRKSDVLGERLTKLEQFLRPEGIEQERILSLASLWARFGERLISEMNQKIDPYNPALHEVRL